PARGETAQVPPARHLNLLPVRGYGMHTSRVEARAPLPQLAGEGGAMGRRKTPVFRRAMGRRKTPVFRRAMGPDGVWPAASKPAGWHDHKSESPTTHSCFP